MFWFDCFGAHRRWHEARCQMAVEHLGIAWQPPMTRFEATTEQPARVTCSRVTSLAEDGVGDDPSRVRPKLAQEGGGQDFSYGADACVDSAIGWHGTPTILVAIAAFFVWFRLAATKALSLIFMLSRRLFFKSEFRASEIAQNIAEPEMLAPLRAPIPLSGVAGQVAELVRSFRVREALALADEQGLLSSPMERSLVVDWLRSVASMVRRADESCAPDAPCSDSRGWLGGIKSQGESWEVTVWYKWAADTVLATHMEMIVNGSLGQVLSLFREGDLGHHCVPFVTPGSQCTFAEDLPAVVMRLQARIPLLPVCVSALIHRAFVDELDCQQGGVLIVERTPLPEEVEEEHCFGMRIPPTPPRSGRIYTLGASTRVMPLDGRRCRIRVSREDDVMTSSIPDFVLRRFAAVNSRALTQRVASSLGALAERGYLARMEVDAQGFYALVERRAATTR